MRSNLFYSFLSLVLNQLYLHTRSTLDTNVRIDMIFSGRSNGILPSTSLNSDVLTSGYINERWRGRSSSVWLGEVVGHVGGEDGLVGDDSTSLPLTSALSS